MKNSIFAAFILNLFFSVFELVGGMLTGSVAILSDALHDFGDALSIGFSAFLEKKSKKHPNSVYSYGYLRYSVLGGVIMWTILLLGSGAVIINSVKRIINPVEVNYNGMIVMAVIGASVNLVSAIITHKGESINQKAVSLHLLEDILGWIVVGIGAVIMKFTDISLIDPVLSLGVAVFIVVNALKGLGGVLDIFLEKAPSGLECEAIKGEVSQIAGVKDVHHIHIRTIDGNNHFATMHIVAEENFAEVKQAVKHKMEHLGVAHTTVEMETPEENCREKDCVIKNHKHSHHGHHHH